jgi:hypothetical protein
LRAARTAFPKRAIEVRQTPRPLAVVANGEARLGVVSSEAFFAVEGDRAVPAGGAEALGVVGYKLAHIVTRRNGPASLEDVRRLGVGQTDSASDRTARIVLGAIGGAGQVSVVSGGAQDLDAQFDGLIKGLVDALFVMAPSTYTGQTEAVETVSAQMLLIGPPSQREAIGAQGPGTTGTAPTQPLSAGTIKELNAALGSNELVDPTLPTPPALRPELAAPPQRLEADLWGAVVNLMVLVLMGYLFYLLVAEPRRARREAASGEPSGQS